VIAAEGTMDLSVAKKKKKKKRKSFTLKVVRNEAKKEK